MSGQLRWIVAGGGTGGHVTPALALAERIRARGDEVRVLGSAHGLETRLVPEAGFELIALPSRQVVGRGVLGRIAGAASMALACIAAWRALRAFGADVVLSVGGYASVPAVAAAALARVPIAIVEPNAIPGRANRLAARVARRIFVHFEEARSAFASTPPERVGTPGIPVRQELVAAFVGSSRRAPAPPFRLLVFGGSQGARQLNDALCDAAPALAGELEVFHQTGEADRERVEGAYRAAGIPATVVAFERDMPARYRWADLALCRSGAMTVAELSLAALPALLVPYPYAADDHQAANARALVAAGAARMLSAHALSGALVADEISRLLAAPGELQTMSAAASKLARPDAADRIVEECAALVGAGG